MGTAFTIESIKFYKTKSQWFVRAIFLLALALNLGFSLFPIGDNNFSALMLYTDEVSQNMMSYAMNPQALAALPAPLSQGNIVFMISYLILQLVNLTLVLTYAGGYSAERVGKLAGEGIKRMLISLPKVLLLLLILIIPALFSSFLFWIPLIVLVCALCFAPLFYSEHGMGFVAGLKESIRRTKGRKLYIFVSFALLGILFDLASLLVPDNPAITQWILPFFDVLLILMRGRLLGLLYVFFYRQVGDLETGAHTGLNARELFDEVLEPGPGEVWRTEETTPKDPFHNAR